MPRLRLAEDGPRSYRADGIYVKRGDEVDVDDLDRCVYLSRELGYFDVVDGAAEVAAAAEGDDAAKTGTDGGSESEDEPPDDVEEDAGDDDASENGYEFDADSWFDDHEDYQAREDRVLSGDVDDHLEEIVEMETSGNVEDAVGIRRAELEG